MNFDGEGITVLQLGETNGFNTMEDLVDVQ